MAMEMEMNTRLDIAIVAGESSGDFLSSLLIPQLYRYLSSVRMHGIGGKRMIECGFISHWPIEKLSVNGLFEVIPRYLELKGIQSALLKQLCIKKPDVFIGVDSPDFNLPLEVELRKLDVPTIHFISPSVWAWRSSRIRKIEKAVSHILVIFPFEEEIYQRAGIPVTYIGHPLAEIIPLEPDVNKARSMLGIPTYRRTVALMPGSRMGEIRYNSVTFVRAAKILLKLEPSIQFLAPMAGNEQRILFSKLASQEGLQDLPIQILDGTSSHTVIEASDAVLVASGTASLEVALYKKPMVISYRMMRATWEILRRMSYKPWIGLPNILAGEFLVPELLQNDATPQALANALWAQLEDSERQEVLRRRFTDIHYSLLRNTAERGARAVLDIIGKNNF